MDKIRLIAGERRLAATKRLLAAFPGRIRYSAVRKAVRGAFAYLRRKHPLSTRVNRELVMISAMAVARRNPSLAIVRWRQFSRYFSPHENEKVWTKIAEWAIRWRLPKTLALFQLAGDAKYHDNSARAWRVRAALREGNFGEILRVTEAMPKEQQMISAWRYWRAFALLKTGDSEQANKMIRALAEEEDDFYGLLAREKSKIPLVHKSRIPDNGARTADDFLLALAVFESGEAELARRIWRFAAAREDCPKMIYCRRRVWRAIKDGIWPPSMPQKKPQARMICVFRNRLAMRLKIAPYNLAWTPLWFLRLSDKKAVLCRPFAPPPVRAD